VSQLLQHFVLVFHFKCATAEIKHCFISFVRAL